MLTRNERGKEKEENNIERISSMVHKATSSDALYLCILGSRPLAYEDIYGHFRNNNAFGMERL